jgi:uncharacterized protein
MSPEPIPPPRAHDPAAILARVLDGYALDPWGAHGVWHWARVHENGQRLAVATGADPEVVALFALFHDARRENEDRDPGHGLRGAEFARTLRGALVHLEDARFELFAEACERHTDGSTTGDRTLQACWDADLLFMMASRRGRTACAVTRPANCCPGRTHAPARSIAARRWPRRGACAAESRSRRAQARGVGGQVTSGWPARWLAARAIMKSRSASRFR